MQIPSIPQTNQDSTLLVSAKNVPTLQEGEIVQAEVLTVTDTAVAIRMKNSILEASTDLPLKQGEVLTMLVEEAGQDMRWSDPGRWRRTSVDQEHRCLALNALKELKPAAADMKVLSSFIEAMPQAVEESLPGLSVLEKMVVSVEDLSGSVLKAAVQDSGVLFEAKLRLLILGEGQEDTELNQKLQTLTSSDMKAALLSLREQLDNSSVANHLLQNGVSADTLTAAIDTVLKNIELLQLQSTAQRYAPGICSFRLERPQRWRACFSGIGSRQAGRRSVFLYGESGSRARWQDERTAAASVRKNLR